MVAHLRCVAIPLSHNFWEEPKGCTTHGETHHKRSKFSRSDPEILLSYFRDRAVSNCPSNTMDMFAKIFSARHLRVLLRVLVPSLPNQLRRIEPPITGANRSGWLQTPTFDILNTCHLGEDFRQETGAHFYAKAHISTQPASPLKDARLSLTYEDQVGSSRAEPSSCRRPQARLSQRRLPRLRQFSNWM